MRVWARPFRLLVAVPLLLSGGLGLASPAQSAPINNGCMYTRSNSDLNGDGFDDAVVGDPYATVDGKAEAGAVVVLFGDADGRIGEGQRRLLTQASVPGSNVEAGDHFGWSVAIDDATMDLCADLLIGSPGEDWHGATDAGIAQLISFTPDAEGGPGTPTSTLFSQATLGGEVEAGDRFGSSVAIRDSEGADEAGGAIGAPGEDVDGASDAGAVNVFSGQYGEFGIGTEYRQGAGPLPGTAEAGDHFGASVVAARLAVPGEDPGSITFEWSFVAGAPGDLVSGQDGAGSITMWSSESGFVDQITQDSAGVAGVSEAGDEFGYSVAVDISARSQVGQVVVVGAPGEDVGTVRDAGSVILLRSVLPGLQGYAEFNQGTPGMPGGPEPGDRFGHSVAMRYSADYRLAIGVPYEDVGSVVDAGMVQQVEVPSVELSEFHPLAPLTESSAGTPGTVRRDNRFGLAMAAARGRREAVLLFASPYEKAGSVVVVSDTPGPTGSLTRSWVPGRGGVPTPSGPGRFGWSLGGQQTA